MKYLFFFLSLGILLILSLGFWYLWALQPAGRGNENISFVVTKSESGDSITARLQSANLIRSALASKIYLRLNKLSQKLKPGGYVLTSSMSADRVFSTLVSGPRDIWITIPEGWRREQIAARLENNLFNFDAAEFNRLSSAYEGQLFPDTYLIPAQAVPSDVLQIFLKNFTKKTGLDPKSGVDMDILILASLIEREARTDSDRQQIAGVLKNRLDKNWPLQVDATVQYAANPQEDWWRPIFDTKYPSPYNTYLITGFPPGPICNPGLAAISAAKSPPSSPYWFYLTGTDGITYYAKTLDEHNLNIARYLKK